MPYLSCMATTTAHKEQAMNLTDIPSQNDIHKVGLRHLTTDFAKYERIGKAEGWRPTPGSIGSWLFVNDRDEFDMTLMFLDR